MLPQLLASMTWVAWAASFIGLLCASAVGLLLYGRTRWAQATQLLLNRLDATRLQATTSHYSTRELEGLPPPVQRYFRAALKDGQQMIESVSVAHAGTFNLSQTSAQWKRFTSQQRVLLHRPGFVWSARILMMPGIAVCVHDAYLGGEGILNPALLGLFSLGDQQSSDVLSQGELIRFFAECAWYPTALLPSQGVRWTAVSDSSARAALTDGKFTVSLLFVFNDTGLIESVRADARGATIGNAMVMTPWEGRWWNYQERNGMQIPVNGEASWILPQGRRPYWRGSITSLRYELVDC